MSGIERRLVEHVGGYLLYGYKTELAAQPADERRSLILLLLWVAVHLHRTCIERRVGAALDAWTTVLSTKAGCRTSADHRPPSLAWAPELTSGPAPWHRRSCHDQRQAFSLDPGALAGRHVLIVDDTCTCWPHDRLR